MALPTLSDAPRLAVRALIRQAGRVLLVNAYADSNRADDSDLWCAPGGGVVRGLDLPGNLVREVQEETGLTIMPGPLVGLNEFKTPDDSFHQVELFFLAEVTASEIRDSWRDPEGIVSRRRFFDPDELAGIRYKPDMLADLAFGPVTAARYDPLEHLVR